MNDFIVGITIATVVQLMVWLISILPYFSAKCFHAGYIEGHQAALDWALDTHKKHVQEKNKAVEGVLEEARKAYLKSTQFHA